MNRYIPFSVLSTCVLFAGLSHAAPVSLSGTWYAINGEGADTLSVSGTSTSVLVQQPVIATGSANRGAVTSFGSPVTLDDVGDYLEFQGDYSGSVGNNINYAIRIGFYNSNGSAVASDFSSLSDSWFGVYAASANRSSTGARSNHFYHAPDANQVLDLSNQTTSLNTAGLGSHVTNISTGNRTITFRMERTSATEYSLRLISGSVDHTDTLAVATAPTDTFDSLAVSFRIGSSSGAHTAQFDNIAVTAIPEPGTLALVGMALGALLLFRRRR